MKPDETRNERLKRVASEKAAKKLLAMAAEDLPAAAHAAPDPKRRPGHSRRPDWTVGGRKR